MTRLLLAALVLGLAGCHTSGDVKRAYEEGYEDAVDECGTESVIRELDEALSDLNNAENELNTYGDDVDYYSASSARTLIMSGKSDIESAQSSLRRCL